MHIGIDGRLAEQGGGIGRYTHDLVSSLTAYGQYDYTIFQYEDSQPIATGPRVQTVTIPRNIKKVPLLGEHLRIPKQFQGVNGMHFPHLAVPMGYRKPFVVTAHDIAIYTHPEWFPSGQWLSTTLVVPAAIRRAKKVLPVSSNVGEEIQKRFGVSIGEEVVIPNGYDEKHFAPIQNPTADYLLFVGSTAPYKNLPLLQAIMQRTHLPCCVVGVTEQEFIHAVGQPPAPTMKFFGRLEYSSPELLQLYQNAALLLQPSHYESFGLPILEALACGTPAIVSNIISLHTVYRNLITYAPLNQPDRWVAAIQSTVNTKHRADTGALKANFSWEVLVPKLEAVYTEAFGL